MNIKLGQYKIFNEAASTLSFSLAAKNLYISQSAVSQAINQLEQELETALFIRQNKCVVLTKEGILLHKYINQALELITGAENEIMSYKDLKKGELVIGASDTLSEHFLPAFITEFHNKYPGVIIKVLNRTTLEIISLLKEGQIDIGFLNMPIEDEALSTKECFKVHDIFVTGKKDDNIYTEDEIAKMPLILLEKNSNTRKILDNYFAQKGVLLQSDIEVGAHELLLKLAQVNLGISCVIKEFSMSYLDEGLLHEIKMKNPLPERSIAYSYLKRHTLSASAAKFIKLMEDKKFEEIEK